MYGEDAHLEADYEDRFHDPMHGEFDDECGEFFSEGDDE